VINIQEGMSSAAIREAITLTYSSDGSCTIENSSKDYIDLGLKNEHRTT
jgi:hypothetical protein